MLSWAKWTALLAACVLTPSLLSNSRATHYAAAWQNPGYHSPLLTKRSLAAQLRPARSAVDDTVALPDGGTARWSAAAGKTLLRLTRSSSSTAGSVALTRDATVSANSLPSKLKVIAELPHQALIVVDTYPSLPGGLSYCQSGEESFLRVISLAARQPRETLRLKLASCRDDLELTDDGLQWSAVSRTLQVHWLTGPSKGKASETRTYRIAFDGRALPASSSANK